MTFFDLVDMTVAYVQYMYILISISPKSFPDFYVEPFRTLRYVSLEFIDRFSEENRYNNPLEIMLPAWLPLDYRLQFAFIVVISPFLVSVVGILTVCSTAAFGWIMVTLAALFSMVFGAALLANPWVYSESGISQQTRVLLVSIGTACTILLISLGVFGVHIWRLRRLHEEEAILVNSANEGCEQGWGTSLAEKAVMRSEVNRRALAALMAYENGNKRYLSRCHLAVILPQAVVAAVVLIAGIVFIGLPPISDIRFLQASRIGRMAGSILLFAALLTFMWVTLGIFRAGRKFQLKMYDLLSSTVLGTMMIAISLIYSPVLMNMINIMWCIEVTCGAGEWMPPPGTLQTTSDTSIWDTLAPSCSPCNFSMHEQTCPSELQMNLCGRLDVHKRLAYDQSVPCNEVNSFYKATVVVILLSYTVAYPIFLVVVAHRGTTILEKEYPLEKRLLDEFTERELYYEKVRKSANVSAPVYQAYRRTYRKARLTFLLQRVILVTISCLMSRGIKERVSWVGLMLILLVGMLYFLYTTLLHPYARPVENLYGATQQFVIACVASIGLVGNRLGRENIPFAVSLLLAVVVFLAPLAALIIGLVRTFRKDRERAERLQRRLQNGFAVENKDPRGGAPASNARDADCSHDVVGENVDRGMDAASRGLNGTTTPAEKRDWQDGTDTLSGSRSPRRERGSAEVNFSKLLSRELRDMSIDTSAAAKQQQESEQQCDHEQVSNRDGSCTFMPTSTNEPSCGRKDSAQKVDPSEAAAERIMRDLIMELSGQDNTRSERAASLVPEQNPNAGTNNGVDFPEDDYFNDERFFLPAAYFRGFDDVALLREDLEDEDEDEEEERRKHRHWRGMGRWTGEGTIRNLFSLFSTFRGQLSRGSTSALHKEPLKTDAEALHATTLRGGLRRDRDAATAADQQQQQQHRTSTDLRNQSDAKASWKGAFFRWWRRWKKVLNTYEFSLKYKDVLEKRRGLQKFTGIQDRPFWLEPSETQQQTYNIPGSCVPWYCAKNNRVVASERNEAGELTVFARLRERKNTKHPPIVEEREEAGSPASIPSVFEKSSFRFGNADTDTETDNTDGGDVYLSCTKKTVAHHSSSEDASTRSQPRGVLRKPLVSLVNHASQRRSREEQASQGQSTSLTRRFECICNAKKKIERLGRLCKRDLQVQHDGERRPTVFAPVFPKVHLEGVEVRDWDDFMQQLLAEVSDTAAASAGNPISLPFPATSNFPSNSILVKGDPAADTMTFKEENMKEGKGAPELSTSKDAGEAVQSVPAESTPPKCVQLLLRHFVLRRRLCDVFQKQKNRLRALQQAVDFRIAVTIKKYMQRFFLALSVCTTLALVLCLCGMLYGKKEDFVDGVWRDNSVERELMGYDSWENFTEHCCCLSMVNLTATYPYYLLDVENWLCEDGRVKQRVRRDAYESTVVSGYRVRDLCGMVFRQGCHPTVTHDNRVELVGCSEELTSMEKKRWLTFSGKMIYDVLELLMNYMQYLYLMVMIAPSVFPTLYSSPFWLVDIVMSAVFSNGGDRNSGSRAEAAQEAEGFFGVQLPSWVPVDLRLLFALTNIFAPLVVVCLSTLLLGPPHFTAFVYLLCASVFWLTAGALLLRVLLGSWRDTDPSWRNRRTLLALTRAVSTHEGIVMTAMSALAVVLLLALGVGLRRVLGARDRARVLERLQQLECAPCTREESVARRLLHFDSTGLEDEQETEKEARVQRARAEMAYQRLFWRRYKETHSLSWPWMLIKLVVSMVCLAAAFVFAVAPKVDLLMAIHVRHVCYPLAALLFLLALLFAASFLLGLTRKGRQRLFKIKLWLRHMLLCVVLLAVSFMYSPILRNAISLFPCRTVGCTVSGGSSHSDDADSLSGPCAACMPGTTTHVSHLSADPNVPCNGIDGFVTASALLVTSVYAVFFLLLYGLITRQALRALRQYPLADSVAASSSPFTWKEDQRTEIGRTFAGDFTVNFPTMPMDSLFATNAAASAAATASRVKKAPKRVDVAYRERVSFSQNEAQFLYAPYTYAFRYFKLVVLAQKTATVIISTLMRQGSGVANPWMGFAACVLIHAGFAVVLVVCRPYAEPLEFVVNLALQVMLSVVAAMGLTSALASTAVPVPLWTFVTSCLFLVPCAAVVAGAILTVRRHVQRRVSPKQYPRQSSCRAERHFGGRWGAWLAGRVRGTGSVRWYEQYGNDPAGHEVFVPALYFVRQKMGTSVGGEPPSTRGVTGACTHAPVEAARATVHADPVDMSGIPANGGCQPLREPRRQVVSGGRLGARRHWARLRAAVYSGHFVALLDPRRQSLSDAPTASRRGVAATVRMSSFSPSRFPEEQPSRSLAMTTLLASVANESRWEMSPYFSPSKKFGDSQKRRARGGLDVSLSPPHASSPPREARRREVFLERARVFSARQRLLTLHCRQKRHLVLQQRAVDCFINAQVAQTIRLLLLFLGVTASMAAALCVCGMLHVEGNPVPTPRGCAAVA